jgi:hypothetical protein
MIFQMARGHFAGGSSTAVAEILAYFNEKGFHIFGREIIVLGDILSKHRSIFRAFARNPGTWTLQSDEGTPKASKRLAA